MKACAHRRIEFLVAMSFVFFVAASTNAQDRCGVVEYTQQLRHNDLLREDDQHFEEWLSRKIATRQSTRESSNPYSIPVVVHVIHKGEAIGTAGNISDAQIISQIKTLNKDYQRLNPDSVNTPDEFKSVAGKINIEFVLARQTPEGKATTGIVRVKGSKNQWSTTDDTTLKALSYWPAEDYLNIWVTDLSSTLLGYAQFPVSSLAGLEGVADNRLTDGVVIDYSVFGSDEYGAFTFASGFTKGRTATHEIGHFLGLRHIWGDVTSCTTTTDYVDDTPKQNASTSGCPSNPQTACSTHKMFQNYMDYTNDPCMNIFTQGQVSRMTTVLENSPRRTSLTTSHGLIDPTPVVNDIRLSEVISSSFNPCDRVIIPQLKIVNVGSNSVSNVSLQMKINSVLAETKSFSFNPAMAVGAEGIVTFSQQVLPSGSYSIDFVVATTNGLTDGKQSDNSLSFPVSVPFQIENSFTERFASLPSTWTITNADQLTTWALFTAPQSTSTNTAAGIRFFQSQSASGQQDVLTTPVFDLSQAVSPYFSFDVAYATNGTKQDGLKIYVITNCGGISEVNKVFDKAGSQLATTTAQTTSFTPSGDSQWRKEIVSLKNFIGSTRVQLAFIGVNDQGNNLYLDNVSVTPYVTENVAITKVISPTPVNCSNDAQPQLLIVNKGKKDIQSLKINYTLNNGAVQSLVMGNGFVLSGGASAKITLPSVRLNDNSNTLSFELTEPNGWVDIDPSDNTMPYTVIVSKAADIIPLRENFDSDFSDQWTSTNAAGDAKWNVVTTNYNRSVLFAAADNPVIGDQAWLVSPVLDLSGITKASVFFDVGYRANTVTGNSSGDTLKVLASVDCGKKFDQVLYLKDGVTLANGAQQQGSWTPAVPGDWKHTYVNLNALTNQSQVRLAFVLINGHGSNTYLDNVEFFISDDPAPAQVTEPFYIYSNERHDQNFITFNLEDRQPVAYELMDLTGRSIASEQLQDVLNQTYQISTNYASTGIYLLRIRIGNNLYTGKILLNN